MLEAAVAEAAAAAAASAAAVELYKDGRKLVSYIGCKNDYANDLASNYNRLIKEKDMLCARRDDIVAEANKHKTKEVNKKCEYWISRVMKIEEEVQGLEAKYKKIEEAVQGLEAKYKQENRKGKKILFSNSHSKLSGSMAKKCEELHNLWLEGKFETGVLVEKLPEEVVFDVEAVETTSNSSQVKKYEIEEFEIEPQAMHMDQHEWDTIIQPKEVRLFLMQGGLGLSEPPKDEDWENVKEIYLMHNELSGLPENPRCPMLLALFLNRNHKLRTIPSSFFDYMPALQILNLSRTGIQSLPESIAKLGSLKRLFLSYCHRLMRLSPKVGELKHLEVLDLEGTDIMDLPKEIMKLTNLTCLEFSFYGYMGDGNEALQSDPVFPSGVISALSHLEELMISLNPDDKRWNECVEYIVTEVCTLGSLNTLHFYFPSVELVRQFILNSQMWMCPSLSQFRFTVGHHVKRIMARLPPDVVFELERWERCLKYINGNGVAIPTVIKDVLQYSTAFFLERHATVTKLSDFGIENMKQLKCCVVGECNEVEVIIDEADVHEKDSEADAHAEDDKADAHEEDDEADACEEDDSHEIVAKTSSAKKIVLGSLEYLCIYYMMNLGSIWKGPVQPKCLSLLKSLTLRTCPQMTTIFTKGLLDNLYNLEELTVDDCPSIKTIVSCEVSAEHKTSHFLPNLKRISLHYMPKLDTISSGLHIAPRLEWLSFYNCPNLKNPLIEEVSSKDLKQIKGERRWWEALEWRSGRPAYLDDIFVPINIWDC